MAVIGIDLGGTKLACAIFSSDGKVLHKTISPLDRRTGAQVGGLVKDQLTSLLAHAGKESIKVEAVGACVPGISYSKSGRVWAPNIPGWDDYPLMDDIAAAMHDDTIKVNIDSDRACYILGEVWQGAAKGCRDAIFLAVGTGIGAGILINGDVLRGSNDIAGAIGWLALDRPFQQKYVPCGCFEYYASGEGLVRAAKEFLIAENNYSGALKDKSVDDITSYDLFEAHKTNDPIAQKVFAQAVELWGMATANLVSLFNPEKITFGGGVFGPAVQFLDAIFNEARKWAQPISINQVSLVPSTLGGDAGLIGAGYLALKSTINR